MNENQNLNNSENQSEKQEFIGNAIEKLNPFFSAAFVYFNKHVFDDLLPNVCLLIETKKSRRNMLLGYYKSTFCNLNKRKMGLISLIIDSVLSKYTVKQKLTTLIHEMIHFEASVKGVKDTDKSGRVHNIKFKYLGEKRGYIINEKSKSNGWSHGTPNDELNAVMDAFLKSNPFPIDELILIEPEPGESKKPKIFKYLCKECGVIVTGKKDDLSIICGNCDIEFELIENEAKDPLTEITKIIGL
ncbi:MAG: hypothetical protein HUJ42_02570 [Malacoplasma sp.]|nr:hypothetical protein [Malacoplasma sp.]